MLKQILLLFSVLFLLTGCERQQQNTNTVFNKEKPSDFTHQKDTGPMPPAPPMLPGKAQMLGAPFDDFQTQTGRAQVTPNKSLIKSVQGLE